MSIDRERWLEKRKGGLMRYLLVDGVVFTGGPFAVVMQIIGILLLRDAGQTLAQYMTSPITWVTFILHGTLFGLIAGYLKWRRNEAQFAAADQGKT